MNNVGGNQENLFTTGRRVEIGGKDQDKLFTETYKHKASGVTSSGQKVSISLQHGWDTVKTKINRLRHAILYAVNHGLKEWEWVNNKNQLLFLDRAFKSLSDDLQAMTQNVDGEKLTTGIKNLSEVIQKAHKVIDVLRNANADATEVSRMEKELGQLESSLTALQGIHDELAKASSAPQPLPEQRILPSSEKPLQAKEPLTRKEDAPHAPIGAKEAEKPEPKAEKSAPAMTPPQVGTLQAGEKEQVYQVIPIPPSVPTALQCVGPNGERLPNMLFDQLAVGSRRVEFTAEQLKNHPGFQTQMEQAFTDPAEKDKFLSFLTSLGKQCIALEIGQQENQVILTVPKGNEPVSFVFEARKPTPTEQEREEEVGKPPSEGPSSQSSSSSSKEPSTTQSRRFSLVAGLVAVAGAAAVVMAGRQLMAIPTVETVYNHSVPGNVVVPESNLTDHNWTSLTAVNHPASEVQGETAHNVSAASNMSALFAQNELPLPFTGSSASAVSNQADALNTGAAPQNASTEALYAENPSSGSEWASAVAIGTIALGIIAALGTIYRSQVRVPQPSVQAASQPAPVQAVSPSSVQGVSPSVTPAVPPPPKLGNEGTKSTGQQTQTIAKIEKQSEKTLVGRAETIAERIDNKNALNILKASNLQEVEKFANETRLILDARVIRLINEFLQEKRTLGTLQEQELYRDMSVDQFIDRLIQKRPDSFYQWSTNLDDQFLENQDSNFLVAKGVNIEKGDIVSESNDTWSLPLSWEEYEISSYLGIAGQAHIKSGGANAESAVFFGCVSAEDISEEYHNLARNHCLIFEDTDRNSSQAWKNFFEVDSFSSYEEMMKFSRSIIAKTTKHHREPLTAKEIDFEHQYPRVEIEGRVAFFDTAIYKKVMERRLTSFLMEADNRAQLAGKKAHLRLKDLSTQAFNPLSTENRIPSAMWVIQCECYAEIIRKYNLQNISELEFEGGCKTLLSEAELRDLYSGLGIKISFTNSLKGPQGMNKLQRDDELLCIQYPWSLASAPGYYDQKKTFHKYALLHGYVQPFRSCTVPLMHNWEVNPNVSAEHMRCYDVSRQGQPHSPHEMKGPPSESDPSLTEAPEATVRDKTKRENKDDSESPRSSSSSSTPKKPLETKTPPTSAEGRPADDEQGGANGVTRTGEGSPSGSSSQSLLT